MLTILQIRARLVRETAGDADGVLSLAFLSGIVDGTISPLGPLDTPYTEEALENAYYEGVDLGQAVGRLFGAVDEEDITAYVTGELAGGDGVGDGLGGPLVVPPKLLADPPDLARKAWYAKFAEDLDTAVTDYTEALACDYEKVTVKELLVWARR